MICPQCGLRYRNEGPHWVLTDEDQKALKIIAITHSETTVLPACLHNRKDLIGYLIGQSDIQRTWGTEFDLKTYHDRILSYGSPPVQYVRALVLNQDIPHRKN